MRRLTTFALLALAVSAGALFVLSRPAADGPHTVRLEPAEFEHRLDGEWRQHGRDTDAPKAMVRIDAPVEVMAMPVSVAEYMACVGAGACAAPDGPVDRGDLPVTGVNWLDANAYAAWLSEKRGEVWRLPTDAEWAQAAGSLFQDDALGIEDDPKNPAIRWLAEYEAESARSRSRDREIRPVGTLNANEHGVRDIGGAVWEWTSTCLRRGELDAAGNPVSQEESCGIYIAEGRHRAALTLFVRDPKSGGCSVGTPPDNMGFRLVREPRSPLSRLVSGWASS